MSRIVLAAAMPGAWLLGVALQLTQPALHGEATYIGLASAGAMVALLCAVAARGRGLALVGIAALAFGVTGWQATERSAARLEARWEGADLLVVGRVDGLVQAAPSGWRFGFAVEQAWHGEQAVPVPPRVQLTWYAGAFAAGRPAAMPASRGRPPLGPGERWQLPVRLRQPHGAANPHGFDAELWWFQQGVGAVGHVRAAKAGAPARRLEPARVWSVDRWRQQLRETIYAQVPDARAAGVIAALVIGDQSAIEDDDWEVFRATGVAHLVAISGLHLTMFAWAARGLVQAAWRRARWAPLWCPAPVVGRWAGVACAAAYAVFAGWGVPAQRTVWMLAAVAALQQGGRRWPWPLVLLAAAVVVTAFDPWALLQAGFWLSFGAVALLLAAQDDATPAPRPVSPWGRAAPTPREWLRRAVDASWRPLHGIVRTQTVATLGLAPLGLLFFHQLSLVGFVANLVAVPLVTLLVTPLALAGCFVPGGWWAASVLVQALAHALTQLASLEHARWFVAAAPPWAAALALTGAAVAVMRLPGPLRWLALPLALPMVLPPQQRPPQGAFEVWALDVGQGSAVVVRTAGRTLLYDTGPAYSGDGDAGERLIVPVLRALGERRLDAVIVSHRDLDHAGGAASVLAAYPQAPVWSSLEDGHPLRETAREHRRCVAGLGWHWDGVSFEFLHPGPQDHAPPLKPNQVSCVLRVSAAGHVALLAGDIERQEETRLVAQHGQALHAHWLLAPHHGSKTSSTAEFLDAVRPQVAVFQAGYRNRFGHPAPAVLARYRSRGIEVVTSARCGAYRWSAGQGHCERDRRPRYWHHRAEAG